MDKIKKENKKLEQDLYIALNKIDKAIEYINNCPKYLWSNVNTKVLLKILGDKEDE